jgi:hypothetical protein
MSSRIEIHFLTFETRVSKYQKMYYPRSLWSVLEYVQPHPGKITPPAIEFVKEYAPTMYKDCVARGLDFQRDAPRMLTAEDGDYKLSDIPEEQSIELVKQMERYYKCQIGKATEEEQKCIIEYTCESSLAVSMLANGLARHVLFRGCRIKVYKRHLDIISGWWTRGFDETGRVTSVIYDIWDYRDIYARKVNELHDSNSMVVGEYDMIHMLYVIVVPANKFEQLNQTEKDAVHTLLQYEQWRARAIVALTGLLTADCVALVSRK